MNANSKINNLRERTNRLLESTDFCGLAVIMLAITLERQVKNAVVFNYRRSGLSASFIRRHLINQMSYSKILSELEWSGAFKEKKIKKIWKEAKTPVDDLFGVMEIRNKIIHSNTNVSSTMINKSANELIFVIEALGYIFQKEFCYNGLDPLPKTIRNKDLILSTKLIHKSITIKFKQSK